MKGSIKRLHQKN